MKKKVLSLKDPNDRKELAIIKSEYETQAKCRSYLTITRVIRDELDLQTLADNISEQSINVIEKNDMQPLEEMLLSQAQVMQSIFHYAAERISKTTTMEQFRAYSDLAIKANGACRKTILGIAHLKNPTPTTFIKQQNNAMNQQINNDMSSKKINHFANELISEEKDNETLDTGGTLKASRVNKKMAAMESGRGKDS